ncbi:hypothetical protein AC579_9149 [Pseudocercospora musae]|uniref:Uncharacterized protein n=1 Tax=Pseudocercospora musae TaxID=113226 RepID=A0A139I6G7_9PEZI|nr:hypothetical protein AC579_9149 [Pseudocercospora musae]
MGLHRAGKRPDHNASRPGMPAADEDGALQAITDFTSTIQEQLDTTAKLDQILASDDPFIDVHELFGLYDILYFRSLLKPSVDVSWSRRLTLCAGLFGSESESTKRFRHQQISCPICEDVPLQKINAHLDAMRPP